MTRDQRFSMLNRGLPCGRVRAQPDGSPSAADRRQGLPLYRGPLTSAATLVLRYPHPIIFALIAGAVAALFALA